MRYTVGVADTTTAVTTAVLVNGEMRTFRAAGTVVRRVQTPVHDGQAEVELSLPTDSLEEGLNRIDVLSYIHRNGGYRLFIGATFTIASRSLRAPTFVPTADLETGTFESGHWTAAYRTFSSHPEWGERLFASWTGFGDILEVPTPLTLRIQASSPRSGCAPTAENADDVTVIAFRDMEPTMLGQFDRISAIVADGEQRVAHLDLDTNFPDDGFHHLVIIALTGMTKPTRIAEAGYAPWTNSNIVTEVFWGWQPTDL